MKILSLPIILIGCLLTVFSADVYANICDISGSGIGGTGAAISKNEGSGLGGTGYPVPKTNGSGIGGTGIIANGSGIGGTGQKTENKASLIIGTITGFGSICVNGVEIHYANSTPVQINDETATTDQLALGQVVSVNASGAGKEMYAKDIHVMSIVTGPISRIDPKLNRITVLGQKIQLTGHTHFPNNSVKTENLQKGSFIQISGLRQSNGEVIASRIDKVNSKNIAQLSGIATNISSHGFMVNGVTVQTKAAISVAEGQKVNISGQFAAEEKIIAEHISINKMAGNQNIIIEGLISFDIKKDYIKLGDIKIQVNASQKDSLSTLENNQNIIVNGTMDTENEIKIEQVFIKSFDDDFEKEYHPLLLHNDHKSTLNKDDSEQDEYKSEKGNFKFEKPEFEREHSHDYEESIPEIKQHDISEIEDETEFDYSLETVVRGDSPETPEIEELPEIPGIEEPPEMPEIEEPPEMPEIEEPPEMPEIEEPETPEIEDYD